MADQRGKVARLREQRQLKQERRGDSPEKAAERRGPREGVVGMMLRIGGVERKSRFKQK